MTNTNVVYVEQDRDWGDMLVYEAIFSDDSAQAKACKLYSQALQPDVIDDSGDLLTVASDAMESSNAWDYQEKGISIAEKLNIGSSYMYRHLSTMSGGERKRVTLTAALLKAPDVLLLDEVSQLCDFVLSCAYTTRVVKFVVFPS